MECKITACYCCQKKKLVVIYRVLREMVLGEQTLYDDRITQNINWRQLAGTKEKQLSVTVCELLKEQVSSKDTKQK